MEVIKVLATKTGVTVDIGEGAFVKKCHILVSTANYFSTKLGGRDSKLDLKKVKMIVFDEADEILKIETN